MPPDEVARVFLPHCTQQQAGWDAGRSRMGALVPDCSQNLKQPPRVSSLPQHLLKHHMAAYRTTFLLLAPLVIRHTRCTVPGPAAPGARQPAAPRSCCTGTHRPHSQAESMHRSRQAPCFHHPGQPEPEGSTCYNRSTRRHHPARNRPPRGHCPAPHQHRSSCSDTRWCKSSSPSGPARDPGSSAASA